MATTGDTLLATGGNTEGGRQRRGLKDGVGSAALATLRQQSSLLPSPLAPLLFPLPSLLASPLAPTLLFLATTPVRQTKDSSARDPLLTTTARRQQCRRAP